MVISQKTIFTAAYKVLVAKQKLETTQCLNTYLLENVELNSGISI